MNILASPCRRSWVTHSSATPPALSKIVVRAAAARTFGPLAGIGQSSHQLGFVIRDTVSDQSGGLYPLYVLSQGPGVSLTLPNIDPGVGVGMNPPSYGKSLSSADRSDAELNYSFSIQRQLMKRTSVEVGWMATPASDITSNFPITRRLTARSQPL
ncbi:MAG: hypothetical protein WBY44_24690 [Bryobacteraceae bacterium]